LPLRSLVPDPNPPSRSLRLRGRGHSPAASDLAGWCGDAARLLHLARRLGPEGVEVCALRGRLLADLLILVQDHAPFELDVTPRAIVFADEPVFLADDENPPGGAQSLEYELSWVLHRDGIRTLRFERGVDEREGAAVLDALLAAAPASATHEDLVTLLWEAGLAHVHVRTEEFGPVRVNPLERPDESAPVPHADDWPLPAAGVPDARRLWAGLAAGEAVSVQAFRERWAAERAVPFPDAAEAFVTRTLAADARSEMADALAASLVTWIATCVQRSGWQEAGRASELLRGVDPHGRRSSEALAHAFASLNTAAIVERLDECDEREQSRLFAFVVRIGAPALPLLVATLAHSGKARARAGATTALAYAFADDPAPLARWLGDTRWHVVRNIVFVLGHIGGADVVPHLAVAMRHPDVRVRRAAIHALGQVPHALRRTVLVNQLDHSDGRLVAAALAMLSREPDSRVTEALLARVLAPEFEARPEDQKVALLGALADARDDMVVPALEETLVRGGWFARRTAERTAAARALARLGTVAARDVLEHGLRHRSDAVREACDEALAQRERE
jgi:HEAT repeat protein